MKHYFIILAFVYVLSGCSIPKYISDSRNSSFDKYTSVTQITSFDRYKFFYVTDTPTVTKSSGSVYGNQYGAFGTQAIKTDNLADVIAGNLMKHGFVRLPSIGQDTIEKTMIVSYGESGRHDTFMGYAIEVTLQFIDATTKDVIATATAAGMGETESDDIKKAINKCFLALFPQ